MGARATLVIAGAGCAGLSLATQLARRGLHHADVILLDPRSDFGRDRTWCSFGVAPHPFQSAVSHRWNRWSVIGDRRIDRSSSHVSYEHLPSDAFYREALRHIEKADNIRLELGTSVQRIKDRGDDVLVETSNGSISASLVFDSRRTRPSEPASPLDSDPPPQSTNGVQRRRFRSRWHPGRSDVNWVQHFVGWFVKTAEPSFDPTRAILMDFRGAKAPPTQPRSVTGGIHFMYLLPFSETEALVEDTYFSSEPLAKAHYEAAIASYLADRGIRDYEITDREQGTIPMTTRRFDPRPSPRVYRLGIAGGLARPSTGYAFAAIQRHSEAFATEIFAAQEADVLPRATVVRNRRTSWLDHVFLSYLQDNPDEGPALFCQLFENNPPERLARFLSETSSALEDAQVMRTLPGRKLVPEAARTLFRKTVDVVRSPRTTLEAD